jgi:hypothetical protein
MVFLLRIVLNTGSDFEETAVVTSTSAYFLEDVTCSYNAFLGMDILSPTEYIVPSTGSHLEWKEVMEDTAIYFLGNLPCSHKACLGMAAPMRTRWSIERKSCKSSQPALSRLVSAVRATRAPKE